jgi:uncharacterized protein (TIGR03000 family)
MYSVVLMAALTSGSAAPDWHPRGGVGHGHVNVAGCSGWYGCYGCGGSVGPWGAPYGGTCIGTYGGYSLSGPNACYGCWGGWSSNAGLSVYSGPGTYGYGTHQMGIGGVPAYGVSFQCHGCYGCYGGWACYGSPIAGYQGPVQAPIDPYPGPGGIAPPPPMPKVPEPPAPLPKKEIGKVRSNVIIDVPENAKLYVDDILMKDGPTQRVFQTPPLVPGQSYFYDIRIEVTTNGEVSADRQRIVIRPGEQVNVAYREPGRRNDEVTVRNAP